MDVPLVGWAPKLGSFTAWRCLLRPAVRGAFWKRVTADFRARLCVWDSDVSPFRTEGMLGSSLCHLLRPNLGAL